MAERDTDSPPLGLSPGAVRGGRSLRLTVGVGAVVVLVVAALAVGVAVTVLTPRGTTRVLAQTVDGTPSEPATMPRATRHASVFVHITGAVAHAGLYELRDGARVMDAVAAAGGFSAEAAREGVNLARRVSDGEQLHVPALGEAAPHVGSGAGPPGAPPVGAKVNVNTASEAELETLPRVGPAMAARIVQWREKNGPFRAIEDLLEVSGIGEKTLDGLRDSVTL